MAKFTTQEHVKKLLESKDTEEAYVCGFSVGHTFAIVDLICRVEKIDLFMIDELFPEENGKQSEDIIMGLYLECMREKKCYTEFLHGKIEALKKKTQSYTEYLKSDHWKKTRKKALKRAKNRCQLCNKKSKLQVHHRTYKNKGKEKNEDLIVLCNDCHAKFHDKLPSVP